MSTSYAAAVARNLAHLGTALHEWRALPFALGLVDGHTVPEVDWDSVRDYACAPSLYAGGVDACCELCGHRIRNVYGVAHDAKRWKLNVGSECVSRFTGEAGGDDLAELALAEAAVELVRELCAFREWAKNDWHLAGAAAHAHKLIASARKPCLDRAGHHQVAPFRPGAVRWLKRRELEARSLLARFAAYDFAAHRKPVAFLDWQGPALPKA